jgi:hypothetical protein
MATYYWVGGAGSWDATTTTHWSLTSGGAGGAGVPTSVDDTIFDSASSGATYTVTMSGGNCRDWTAAGPATGTLQIDGGGGTFTIYGSVAIAATGLSMPGTPLFAFNFSATTTGKTLDFGSLSTTPNYQGTKNFNGIGGGWTLLNNLIPGNGNVTHTAGNLNTNGFTAGGLNFSSTGATVRTLTLGSSTINTFDGVSGYAFTLSGTNLTFNCGTSTINCMNLVGGGRTFYNVSNTYASWGGSATRSIDGGNTFNNFTMVAGTATRSVTFGTGTTTINGTFSIPAPTNANIRTKVYSATVGTAVVINCASASISDTDFTDISFTGAVSPLTGTRLGDNQGNSGITFVAKTVYWNLAGVQNWTATGWALTSGGTPASINYPLSQDTTVFDNTGSVTGAITMNASYTGGVNLSARTTAMTLNTQGTIFGDWENGSGVTLGNNGALTFAKRGLQNLTSAGKTFSSGLTVGSLTGTVLLVDAFTTTNVLTLNSGGLDLNNVSLTVNNIASTTTTAKTIAFGTSSITVTGSSSNICNVTGSNFTVTGSRIINFTYSGSAGTRIINSSSLGCITNIVAGSDILNLTVADINCTGFTGSLVTSSLNGDVLFHPSMTVSGAATLYFGGGTAIKPNNLNFNGCNIDFDVKFDAVGNWKLASNLTGVRTFRFWNGTFNANSYNVTIQAMESLYNQTRFMTMGSGKWTVTGSGSCWTINQWSGVATWNVNTSTTSFTSASAKVISTPVSCFYILDQGGAGALTIPSMTINDIRNSYAGTGATSIVFSGTTTVSNFTAVGTVGKLLTISGGTLSKSTGIVSGKYLSISGNTATGGATWNASTTSTNGGGNVGWVFTNVIWWWVGGAGTWDASTTTNWATSSGGAGSAGVPTAANDVIFDSASNATSYTVTTASGAVCLTATVGAPASGSVTIGGTALSVSGNFTLAATGVTWSSTSLVFVATATGRSITTNNTAIQNVNFNGVGGGWNLYSAFTSGAFTLTAGTFATNNFAVTFPNYISTSSTARGLNLGSSLVTVTLGGTATIWDQTNVGTQTTTPGTSTIRCSAATGKTFNGGAVTYYNIDQGGAGALQITGNSTFNDIQNSYGVTGATTISMQSSLTNVSKFTAAGTAGNILTLNSNTAGTARTINKTTAGNVSVDYLSIQDSTVTGTSITWTDGPNSINISNNTGWIFTSGNSCNFFMLMQ